jgi:predicted ribosome quality control (RQC) complex YloA/Tae2 family protein
MEFMGYEIIIGKNKQDNWTIIDEAVSNDIWFHVANGPSSHVILKTKEETLKKIPKQVITRCACLCKAHSSSKSVNKCEIIYTQLYNVTKTNIVGQVTTENNKVIII